jgi:hypothetical protein
MTASFACRRAAACATFQASQASACCEKARQQSLLLPRRIATDLTNKLPAGERCLNEGVLRLRVATMRIVLRLERAQLGRERRREEAAGALCGRVSECDGSNRKGRTGAAARLRRVVDEARDRVVECAPVAVTVESAVVEELPMREPVAQV